MAAFVAGLQHPGSETSHRYHLALASDLKSDLRSRPANGTKCTTIERRTLTKTQRGNLYWTHIWSRGSK